MKFKDVALSDASTEAKVAGLALLLDKELLKLADAVYNVKKLEGPKGEEGLQGPKGDQGGRGFDGTNGKDGRDGSDGLQGDKGDDGVGVADARIDFDGSLVIVLTNGKEINAGDVVPLNVTEKLKIVKSTSGTANSVLEAIDAINTTLATYGTMATQNKTSVDIEGGTIDNTAIGGTTPAAGTFTTLTATGQTSLGGVAGSESFRATVVSGANMFLQASGGIGGVTRPSFGPVMAGGSGAGFNIYNSGNSPIYFATSGPATNIQFLINHISSSVNYVQVTGAATNAAASALGGILMTGSDASPNFAIGTKGSGYIAFYGGAATNVQPFRIITTGASASGNLIAVQGAAAGSSPSIQAISGFSGTDTNIDLTLTPKGTGNVRFGTLTANADAPITGYITIKDSGGTVRKLAVIA